MKCREAEERLWSALDSKRDDPTLQEHINSCPKCKNLWSELVSQDDDLRNAFNQLRQGAIERSKLIPESEMHTVKAETLDLSVSRNAESQIQWLSLTRVAAYAGVLIVAAVVVTFSFMPPNFEVLSHEADQRGVHLDGKFIVYEDYRGNNVDIFLYNLVTHKEHQVTFDLTNQRRPMVSDNLVVYTDEDSGSVKLFDLDNGTDTQISTTGLSGAADRGVINSTNVVYQAISPARGVSGKGIFHYDMDTTVVKELTPVYLRAQAGGLDIAPDGTVVYHDNRFGKDNIFVYDLIRDVETPATSLDSVSQRSPSTDGTFVVWNDDRAGTSNTDIWAKDLSGKINNGKEFQVSTNPLEDEGSDVEGNLIVWRSQQPAGNWVVMGYEISSKRAFQISGDKALAQGRVKISGNAVVWVDNQEGDSDIYGAILTGSGPPDPKPIQ